MMRSAILFLLIQIFAHQVFGQHSLTWAWSSDTSLKTPESVLFDPVDNCLWVSCINGKPTDVDGNGGIWQLRIDDGRIIDREWLTSLNAPKGLARFRKQMFVSDITELVVIDIYERKINRKIPVPGASFLNDVTVDENGAVYISDSNTGKVHIWKDDKMEVYLDNIPGVNGILAIGDALFMVASGAFYKYQAGNLKKLAEGMDKSTDGLEMVKPGEFVVSCWNGIIYYVTEAGKLTQMLDTRKRKSNTADIGLDRSSNRVFVPTFFKNSVVAYQLK